MPQQNELDTQKLVKLVLFNLLQTYPSGMQISSLADNINYTTNSNSLNPPYHRLKLTLDHLIDQGCATRLKEGRKYYLSSNTFQVISNFTYSDFFVN